MSLTHGNQLNIISRAWGRKLDDTYYCFFPWIDREEQAQAGTRRAGFHEGPAFEWPTDRAKILEHMRAHEDHDLYWCPSLFEYGERKKEFAADERSLWADLDEVDPRTLEDYPPTVAWETSPGRYQALWILNQGDIQGASWAGRENQRLTYHIGADEGGWDTTQLLRIPGWKNHKLHYQKQYGEAPEGKLLWKNKRFYLADDFTDLPEVEGAVDSPVADAILGEVDRVNTTEVRARVRLKLNRRIRDYLSAREATGDRSDVLWEIETSLAEVGCTVAEIIAIVRSTVWNKYEGRADEMNRLLIEATKATSKITAKKEDVDAEKEALREEADEVRPQRLDTLLANIKPPVWLVKNILSEGSVGFIAGEPKSFKSWFGLDLAISVATGARYLNYFDVVSPGPVLYIQEEDPGMTVKDRKGKIERSKKMPQLHLNGETEANGRPVVEFHPPQSVPADAPVAAVLQGGLVLSDEIWQEWLDETLARGYMNDSQDSSPFKLVIIDTLMMVAGDVEENRAQEMTTKIFKPVKELARKHNVALLFVHHMRKGGADGKRGGQRMLGSVANHAWSEDSMYLSLTLTRRIEMECESKSYESRSYVISGVGAGKGWQPVVTDRHIKMDGDGQEKAEGKTRPRTGSTRDPILQALMTNGGSAPVRTIVEMTGLSDRSIRRRLEKLEALHKVRRQGRSQWYLT